MKFYKEFSGLISRNNLSTIHPNLSDDTEGVIEVANADEVYNCLHQLEGSHPAAWIVLINNSSCTPQLVLMNHSHPVLCLEYDEEGQPESILPVPVNKRRGINRQVFYRRYIVFLPLPENFSWFGSSDARLSADDGHGLSTNATEVGHVEPGNVDVPDALLINMKNRN